MRGLPARRGPVKTTAANPLGGLKDVCAGQSRDLFHA